MIVKIVYIIFILIIIMLTFHKFLEKDNIKFMNIFELIEFNLKQYLIYKTGITYLNKDSVKNLNVLTNDEIMIKMHRKLQKKYDSVVSTYLLTNAKNYYILDPELGKKILNSSPYLFGAGKIKKITFNLFMPNNVGISECDTKKTECPWKKRRSFNEYVLGTKHINDFYKCIPDIIKRNINNPPLNVNDFTNISFNIVSNTIYGNITNADLLKNFVLYVNNDAISESFLKSNLYEKYTKNLQHIYYNAPICSLLYYANLYKNDELNIINDQIPHWFFPFILVINFLIPNLLCILLNYKENYNKLLKDINKPNFNIQSKKTYLHYCVIEHIRLFNTVNTNMQRTVLNDMKYENINFKKGDQIYLLFSSILRNVKQFHKPDEFIPERWANKPIDEQDIVFGVGPQQCPSKQLTPIYYKLIIHHLLTNYKYKSVKPILKNKELYFINPFEIEFKI